MARWDEIDALLAQADRGLAEVEALYKKSLAAQRLDAALLIQIKNLLENLRSAFDYAAREIFDRFCASAAAGKDMAVYFPILRATATAKDFAAMMNGRLPGLDKSSLVLYALLEKYQVYASKANEWLVQFNELCQENKHEQFSAQTRTEERQTRITTAEGSVAWNEGVTFGPGAEIRFGPGGALTFGPGGSVGFGPSGVSIAGRRVDPRTQMPRVRPGDKLERVTVVDYFFTAIGTSVMPFLKKCVTGVRQIVAEVRAATP